MQKFDRKLSEIKVKDTRISELKKSDSKLELSQAILIEDI